MTICSPAQVLPRCITRTAFLVLHGGVRLPIVVSSARRLVWELCVNPPRPALKLNADRADLDLVAAIANDRRDSCRSSAGGSLCAETGSMAR